MGVNDYFHRSKVLRIWYSIEQCCLSRCLDSNLHLSLLTTLSSDNSKHEIISNC